MALRELMRLQTGTNDRHCRCPRHRSCRGAFTELERIRSAVQRLTCRVPWSLSSVGLQAVAGRYTNAVSPKFSVTERSQCDIRRGPDSHTPGKQDREQPRILLPFFMDRSDPREPYSENTVHQIGANWEGCPGGKGVPRVSSNMLSSVVLPHVSELHETVHNGASHDDVYLAAFNSS